MKIYITDCDHDNVDIEREIFLAAGMEMELKEAKTEEEVIEQCKDGEVLIVQYARITEKVMEELADLKFVVRYGVGVDTIDLAAAEQRGIQVCNVPDYGMNEVADHAIALLLTLKRKIALMNTYTKNQRWDYIKAMPIHRFSEETVGVVGLGRIGRCFAQRAHALGFRVLGYDPFYKETEETGYIESVDFDTLVKESDAISLHCPADGNRNLFDAGIFQKMKDSAVIINVARGGIINEADLDRALEEGMIAGAGIDCMETEPMPADAAIFRHENLIVTPHMAWYSEEAAKELKRKVAEESVRFVRGEKVHYPVNRLHV